MDVETVDPLEVEVPEESEAPEVEEQAEEQPRAEDGTFASKEKAEPEEQPPEGQDEPPPEAPEVPVAWSYTADGQRYDVGTVGADGAVVIPADQAPHIQQLLAAGRHHQGNWQRDRAESQRQVEAAKAEVEASEAVRQNLLDEFERVAGLSEEEAADYVATLRDRWPTIKAQAEAKGVETRFAADRQRLAEFEQRERERQLEPEVFQSIEDRMLRIHGSDPRFKALTQQDLQAVYGRLAPTWRGLLITETGAPWTGEGTPWLNNDAVDREMEYAATIRGRQVGQDSATAAAKKANAAELGGTKAPPAVKAKPSTTPAKGSPKGFTPSKDAGLADQTREVDEWFDSLEVDDE